LGGIHSLNKFWLRILVFIVVVTIGQVYTLHHYNNIVMKTFSGADKHSARSFQVNTQAAFASLKSKYSLVALSENARYAAYIDRDNVLRVTDLLNHRQVLAVRNIYPVDYVTWIRNDSVFISEKEPNGVLFLQRVDMDTGYA
jgi:hypothetical protein